MPTGYGHQIIDGDGVTPRQYLLSCARAFGATVMQRDDPMNAPLKTTVEPSAFYLKEHGEACSKLDALQNMSNAERESEAAKEHSRIVGRNNDWHDEWIKEERRYDAMESAVHGWTPPTDEHRSLKEFALEQISRSRSAAPIHIVPCESEWRSWYEEQLEGLQKNVKRYAREYEKEVERCADRTQWLTTFVESLPAEEE